MDSGGIDEIADLIPRGGGFVLLGHFWAVGFKEALRYSNGVVVAYGWVTPATLVAIGKAATAEAEAIDG